MPKQLLLHPSVDKFGVGPLTQNATTCQMIVITGTECYPKGPKHPKKKPGNGWMGDYSPCLWMVHGKLATLFRAKTSLKIWKQTSPQQVQKEYVSVFVFSTKTATTGAFCGRIYGPRCQHPLRAHHYPSFPHQSATVQCPVRFPQSPPS